VSAATVESTKRSERIRSRFCDLEVLAVRWGHFGTPVLLFPTAGGDAEECERFKMLVVLRPLVEAGRIKVYSCDSVGGKALTERKDQPAGYFPRMQNLFDRFVTEEFVPWIREDCRTPDIGIVAAGASIGAFNAVAAICRHPEIYTKAIGMSGTYDVSKWLEKEDLNQDFYFSSPMHFLPNLGETPPLKKLRERFVVLATGEGDYEEPESSIRMSKVLQARGVPCRYDSWGKEFRHDWTTWREMLPKYLGEMA
jgi:esterase/lipase superfamily enzyme